MQEEIVCRRSPAPSHRISDARRRVPKKRGSLFILATVTLAVLMVLGILSLQVATNTFIIANRQRQLTQALHLAEAAADMAEAYIRSQSSLPNNDFSYPLGGGTVTLTTGTCSARVIGNSDNDSSWMKAYTIIGTGVSRGGSTRRVIVQLRQQSFALYSYFSDSETSSQDGDTIWFYARDRVYGPVHSNDEIHISWQKTSADPIFYGTVSSAADSVDWGDSGTPVTTQDWRRVLDGGRPALVNGVQRIAMPANTDNQQVAAWGQDYGYPSSNGIYLPTSAGVVNAGIYIRGDSTVAFSVQQSTGNQVITITRGTSTKTFTIDRVNNTTKVAISGGSTTTYPGVPNGAIYSTGNITSLKGTLADNYYVGTTIIARNSWTVATDVENDKDITITDDLEYKTPPDDTKPTTHPSNLRAATLGLVARNIILDEDCPNNLTIDGVMMAGGEYTDSGSFYYAGWQDIKRNNLNVLGGIIQKQRGPVGTFNAATNNQISGYNKNYRYDARMMNAPPPFFPTTGQYDVLSWQYQ